jgi:nucleolar MIF4G domain-containing protein 1
MYTTMSEGHGIRLPGQLLDRIQQREDQGEYQEDRGRYTQFDANFSKKRKGHQSRKEKRQQEREAKKQRRAPRARAAASQKPAQAAKPAKPAKPAKSAKPAKPAKPAKTAVKAPRQPASDSEAGDAGDEDPMEQLRRLKAGRAGGAGALSATASAASAASLRVVKEDDLGDDLFSELSESGLSSASEPEEKSDPMEQLRRLKAGRAGGAGALSTGVRVVREDDLGDDLLSGSDSDALSGKYDRPVSSADRELMRRDEEDIAYYAKKLGLKSTSRLAKQGEDDTIGGLLDGLDFVDEWGASDGGEDEGSGSGSDGGSGSDDGFASAGGGDDASSAGDDDFDDEDLRELREMEALEGSDAEADSGDTVMAQAKENPYVAPGAAGGYVPPARRAAATAAAAADDDNAPLRKAVQRALNKLSEANLASIAAEINALYAEHPRHAVTATVTAAVMDAVQQQGRLLDAFVHLEACLAAAVHRAQGAEFGAYFVQTLVERLDRRWSRLSAGDKEASNLTLLLLSVYAFEMVLARLLYDVVRELIARLDEPSAELLLRLVQALGNQMRAEDPQLLREVIRAISASPAAAGGSPRMQFLVETITSLKNNKLRLHGDAVGRLRRALGALGRRDPLQVGLEDIRGVEERGKWWLVGSAWRGQDAAAAAGADASGAATAADDAAAADGFAEVNWTELARAQRMNTDVRRAVFVSIMSASDYVDAVARLDKLRLTRAQEREIPRIILHCAAMEPAWNPYYGVLAAKLCDTHAYRKTFQFLLWDVVRELGDDDESEEDFFGDDDDDAARTHKLLNVGRLYGHLVAQGALSLSVLRTIDFVTAAGDVAVFAEVLLVLMLDHAARAAQTNVAGAGTAPARGHEPKFDPRALRQCVLRAAEQPVLLGGIKYFLERRVPRSPFVTGRKQRRRVEWGVEVFAASVDALNEE